MTDDDRDDERVDAELWKRRHALLYRVELSSLYHRKRERFYDTGDRTSKAVALIFGSAAFSRLLENDAIPASETFWLWGGLAVAITSAVSLVFSFSERARRHAELAKSFGEVGAELVRSGESRFNEEDLDRCDARIRLLEATEPASLGALVCICQNEIAQATGHPENVIRLRFYQRWFAHLLDFHIEAPAGV